MSDDILTLQTKFKWSLQKTFSLPAAAAANRAKARMSPFGEYPYENGLSWEPYDDESVKKLMVEELHLLVGVFGAAAKKQGFRDHAGGITAKIVSCGEHHITIKFTMKRSK